MYNKNVIIILSLFFLYSCGSSYNSFSRNMKNSLINNKNLKIKEFKKSDSNYLLLNQEAGLFSFLKSDTASSTNYFNKAIDFYKMQEQSSNFNTNKVLASTVTSDNVIQYEGSDYERSLVHYYNSLNYVYSANLNDALLEIRAIEESQKFAEQVRQKKIIASEAKINKFLNSNKLKSKDLDSILAKSRNIRANTKSKFLNANALYLAGNLRELTKDYNEALVNYKQALDIYPNNPYIINDAYRLALIYDQDYAIFLRNMHPIINTDINQDNYKQQKTVLIIYEQGFVPEKHEFSLNFVAPNNTIISMHIPIYSGNNKINNVNVTLNQNQTEILKQPAVEISDIYNLALNDLYENYPSIIARQISRLTIQVVGQNTLSNNNHSFLALAFGLSSVFNTADIRSWRTLPNYTLISKSSTLKDFNNISISINKNKVVNIPNVNIKNGQTAIFYIFDTGSSVYTKLLTLYNK